MERIQKYYTIKKLERPYFKGRIIIFFFIRNLRIKKLSKKLNYKRVGPFKVKKKILKTVFELKLFNIIRLNLFNFHISLSELVL